MVTESTPTVSGQFATEPVETSVPPSAEICCGSVPGSSSEATSGCCGADITGADITVTGTADTAGSCCGSESVGEATAAPVAEGGCCR